MILDYPDSSAINMDMRKKLKSRFSSLTKGISEFTFANIYLFRESHNYRISKLNNDILITGSDNGEKFFMLPFTLPEEGILKELFKEFSSMKCVPEKTADMLKNAGYAAAEDRDNFDYIYLREELSKLAGRKFHKKKNLVNAFLARYACETKPLTEELIPDALQVLEKWKNERPAAGDYTSAKEALEKFKELALNGAIYYIEKNPVGYALGEELSKDTYVAHFEKALSGRKGLSQFVTQSFASSLPEKYIYINMEQDLGIEGIRKAKISFRPVGFIKKYRVTVL